LILGGVNGFLPPRCPPLPDVPNVASTVFVDRYGAAAIFTYAVGYAFKEGGTSRTSVCNAVHWTAIDGCQGSVYTIY